MKTLIQTLALLFVVIVGGEMHAAGLVVKKGDVMLSGETSLTRHSSCLGGDPGVWQPTFSPSVDLLITRRLFLGMSFSTTSRTRENAYSQYSMSHFLIGPEIGLVFGDSASEVLPVMKCALQYSSHTDAYKAITNSRLNRGDTHSGLAVAASIRVLIPVHRRMALGPMLGYSYHVETIRYNFMGGFSGFRDEHLVYLGVGLFGWL